jgi:hypothetical protein
VIDGDYGRIERRFNGVKVGKERGLVSKLLRYSWCSSLFVLATRSCCEDEDEESKRAWHSFRTPHSISSQKGRV